jgi:hypothetical protein
LTAVYERTTVVAMKDFLLLMHGGTNTESSAWGPYLAGLRASGVFQGGSSIGDGVCVTRGSNAPEITRHLSGYIKIRANDLAHATSMLAGNPVYEAGGVVEIRELPVD